MKKKLKEYFLKSNIDYNNSLLFLYFLLYLYFNETYYIIPNENNYAGDELKVKIEKVKIKTSDNLELLGWFHEKNLSNFKTVVFFHGNAGMH